MKTTKKAAKERTNPPGTGAKLTTYTDRRGKRRWRIVGGNGEIVASSAQGYSRKEDLDIALRIVRDVLIGAGLKG